MASKDYEKGVYLYNGRYYYASPDFRGTYRSLSPGSSTRKKINAGIIPTLGVLTDETFKAEPSSKSEINAYYEERMYQRLDELNELLAKGEITPAEANEEARKAAQRADKNVADYWQERAEEKAERTGDFQTLPGGSAGFDPNDDREDVEFDKLIEQSDLPDDIKQIARATFSAISTNDLEYAKRLVEGIKEATKYADPYFKAQTRLAIDALERGFQDADDDLEYNEERLSRQLEDLRKDTQGARELLSLEEQQELAELDRQLSSSLDATREEMASLGFTSSSRRARKEQITQETFGGLRETKQRQFAFKQQTLADTLTRGERDTAAEAERLRELAKSDKLKLLRETEETVGSDALRGTSLGGLKPLGNVTGSLQNERAREIADLASSFVF